MVNKKLAQAIEKGFLMQELCRKARKEADEAEAQLREYKKKLINTFIKDELTEVKTSLGTAKLKRKTVPHMDPATGGWEAVYAYIVGAAVEDALLKDGSQEAPKLSKKLIKHIAQTGNWEILHKRLGERACVERWENKEKIPGVIPFDDVDLKFGEGE